MLTQPRSDNYLLPEVGVQLCLLLGQLSDAVRLQPGCNLATALALAAAALTAALAAAALAAAALAAAKLHYGREWCPLSRQRERHRQRPPVPSVDESNAAHAHKNADCQTKQRPGRPQLLSQPGRRSRALVLHDGSCKALGALQQSLPRR